MKADHPPVLLALADRYRKSKAGREGSQADHLTDFRELLKSASSSDGDARVRAVEDLRRAEHESAGLLSLDRHPKDPDMIHRVRLRPEGEVWLFQRTGQTPPTRQREQLAAFFRKHCEDSVPEPGWSGYFTYLSKRAVSGESVQPFVRDDMQVNEELVRTAAAVISWKGESLIRFASSVICGDSKRLEALQSRLLQILRGITGDPDTTLETYQILQTPRSVLLHGPLVLELPGGSIDLGSLAGPIAVSGSDVETARKIHSSATTCLSVENEGVFRELAKRNSGALLVHTSFPGSATRSLLLRLPATLSFHHFGDSDPAGFDILRDLREKTGRDFQPVSMDFRPKSGAPPLTATERATLERLMQSLVLRDVHPALQAMLEHGTKGDFEQESIGLERIHDLIAQFD